MLGLFYAFSVNILRLTHVIFLLGVTIAAAIIIEGRVQLKKFVFEIKSNIWQSICQLFRPFSQLFFIWIKSQFDKIEMPNKFAHE